MTRSKSLRAQPLSLAALTVLVAACASSADPSSSDQSSWHGGTSNGGGGSHGGTGSESGGGAGSGATTADAGGSGSGGGAGSTSPTGNDAGGAPSGGSVVGLFKTPEPWNARVDSSAKSSGSDAIIQYLAGAGGWGTSTFKIDSSIEVLHADASTPMKTFTPTGDFYSPDCDLVPFPVPANGVVEGETGYTCTGDGDCHLLVVHDATQKLYEMWRANIDSSGFNGGCVAVWDLTKAYPASLRGDGCTSADAGGFPITAMLANADEVAAGEVAHALRFILPNSRIRSDTYVHPGSHTTSATSAPSDAPPYGVRMRLRADYPLASLPSDGARVLAVALQRYGMFLADGGNVPLTIQGDGFTQHKWSDVGVDDQSLGILKVTDFEVVEMGAPITGVNDCTRN